MYVMEAIVSVISRVFSKLISVKTTHMLRVFLGLGHEPLMLSQLSTAGRGIGDHRSAFSRL